MPNSLSVQPLLSHGGFNWIFLVEILVCAILALFFLFYFNRLFATLIGYCIRAWTWHQYRAYIDITSLQISLLGGRIFFKGLRYHAHNVTLLVYDGHITWRYWLRLVQDAEVFEAEDPERKRRESAWKSEDDLKSSSDEKEKDKRSRSIGKEEKAGGRPKKELPCRISVKANAIEAFVYNRSPLYDIILEQTLGKTKTPETPPEKEKEQPVQNEPFTPLSGPTDEKRAGFFGSAPVKTHTRTTTGLSSIAPTSSNDKHKKPELPPFLRMFPVRIECKRVAATLGNENTTSVIAAKLEKAAGTIDAGHAGLLDLYKLLFNFDLEKINVTLKPNRDFKQLQLDAAKRILREREISPEEPKRSSFNFLRTIRKRWHSLTGFFSSSKSVHGSLRDASLSSEVDGSTPALQDALLGQGQWHGLDRYMDETELNEHDEWKNVEYAKASTLADIEKLNFRFYFDIAGVVPHGAVSNGTSMGSAYANDINGSKPPDYGMEFAVYGGTVTYGPWTDRQRLILQQIFFPAPYVDAVPAATLKPGDTRAWTLFKIFISIEEDLVLRVPTRESSKDDKWQGRAGKSKPADDSNKDDTKRKGHGIRHKHNRRRKGKQGNPGIDARPYAWLDVRVKTDSTVNYTMDMFPSATGYRNSLEVDVKGTEIESSVNHGLLWRTGSVSLDTDLSQPAEWKTLRKWPFNIEIDDLELFILRDHMFLIIDMVNDWSSGAPSDFYTFVPYVYSLRMLFRNFIIYLNVNDSNIVNDPAELDRNDFLTLEGVLDSTLDISMDQYRPVRNWITFDVLSTDMRMRMLSPSRATMNTFLKDKVVAELPKLTLKGSYSGHLEERPGLVDTLRFDIVGSGLTLKAYGYLVRQLINVKENYFGDYMHFKTLEEFQDADEDLSVANIKTASLPKPKFINELDVILCIIAEDAAILFPTNLYSADEFVRAELPLANLDLRIVSYYLDMGLQMSPLKFLSSSTKIEDDSPVESASSTQMFVKHMDLDGHRSFGLPPDEPAYISQWDIDVGAITGEFSSSFIHNLTMAGRAFVFGFSDRENALPLPSPSIFYEATFVQVRTDLLRIWFHVGKDALLFSSDPIEVSTNDWAGDTFSQRVNVMAPKITLACIDGKAASRIRGTETQRTPVRTYAFLQTGASVSVVMRKLHFEEEKRKQQAHLRECDQRTRRVPFLLREGFGAAYNDDADVLPPAMPYPYLPPPLNRSGIVHGRPSSIKSIPSYASGRQVRSKKSSSSLSASLQKAGLVVPSQLQRFKGESVGGTPSSSRSLRSSSPASSMDSAQRDQRRKTDRQRSQPGMPPASVAFSSSFAEPYFPLDLVEPDESNVPDFVPISSSNDQSSDRSSLAETINDPDMDYDAAQTSVLIQLVPGIRAYVEPRVAITGTKLLRKLLPKQPEEVMDAYQMDVLGAVAAKQVEHSGNDQTLEIQIGLPSARLRAVNPAPKELVDDQVDVNLRSVETLVRTKQQPSADGAKEVLAVHLTMQGILATVGQARHGSNDEPAVRASIDDVLLWIAVAASQSIHTTVGDTILSISGRQAEYLTAFVLRLLPIVDDVSARIDATLQLQRKRLLLLIYTLTQNSEGVGDPPFLSRLTPILRAFPSHFRNQESWKVVVRFRHILNSLPPGAHDQLKTSMKHAELDCPSDAPAKALDDWAQWHNWDVPNVSQTIAVRSIFDEMESNPMAPEEQKPMSMTVRSEYLRVAIEPGEDGGASNEVVFEETSLGMERTPPTAPTGLMLVDENTRTKTVLQMHTTSAGITINWSAVGIAERVLQLHDKLQDVARSRAGPDAVDLSQRLEDNLNRHIYQVVASTDSGSIALQTLNLRHVSRADGLKLSLIGISQRDEEYGPCISAIVNADAAVTELHGPTRQIWQTLLTSPSVYVDHMQPNPGANVPQSVTVAVAYKILRIELLEQIPGLLQIVDRVIRDEVTKVLQLVESTKQRPAPDPAPMKALEQVASAAEASVKVHVALLAGELHLEVSLLQALKYQLAGTAGSIRVAPSFSGRRLWAVDFDVGQQSHSFVNTSANQREEQSILHVPPINGHVGIELGSATTSLSVTSTMERVDVDATAIQSVMGIFSRPEVRDITSAIKAGIGQLQDRVEALKPAESTAVATKVDEKQIAFDVRFALLGIRVGAVTSRFQSASTAEVEFGIGPLHAIASNRATLADTKSLVPEIRAQIRDIGARLQVHEDGKSRQCGNVTFGLDLHFNSSMDDTGKLARYLKVKSHGLEVNAYPETASTAVDVINHLQDRIKNLDLSKEVEYLRRLHDSRRQSVVQKISGKKVSDDGDEEISFSAVDLLTVTTTVQLSSIKIAWLVDQTYLSSASGQVADLVLSLDRMELTTKGGKEARLTIEDLQLQLVERNAGLKKRSVNSALMPEVSFSVAYSSEGKNRSLAFKAAGKPLEIRLESRFIFPVSAVERSITAAINNFKTGTATWQNTPTTTGAPRSQLIDMKRLAHLLVEADFAGAQLYLQGSGPREHSLSTFAAASQQHGSQHGRYGQFAAEGTAMQTTLRAPGIALKVEYNAGSNGWQPTVNGEIQIDASSNMLLPNVVPLLLEVSNGVKEVMSNQDDSSPVKKEPTPPAKPAQRFFEDESIVTANPSAIFGKTKVDLGLRVRRQEFGLTCQPIARIDAKGELDDFYITMNTINSDDHGHFFAISTVITKLGANVKHVYSREPTFSFDMESVTLSVLNSKHLSGTTGISAILKINPTRTFINGKQLQDLLLFREIWVPPEIRASSPGPASEVPAGRPEDFIVQKYHTVAAAAAFPWNATISIAELAVDLDLGQSIGKSSFTINNLWASQTKSSNWEQNLCIGMDEMAMTSTGRMSGFIRLNKLGVRTSIKWPQDAVEERKTPLIQASVGFQRLLAKAAFDYQAFAFGDIEGFDFLMYNVHQAHGSARDRLVAVLDCEKAYVFCTSTSAARAVGLYQAFDRFIQEKQAAYSQSLREIEKHVRQQSTVVPTRFGPMIPESPNVQRAENKAISLHTDVVLTIGTISFGVFPSTFFDSQILKLEANDIQARFAVGLERGKVASALGMTLGQLQVALASVKRATAVPKALDVSVDEVVSTAVNAKGGIILRVPKVLASMQTWQAADSKSVDYIFKSLFDGKIDVGWNLARIDFIKNMWTTHSRSLASRLGKALPESAVKITAAPAKESGPGDGGDQTKSQDKITAEFHLPQFRYDYHALEPPVIETPQLRDMGEATPPLEWIGLHRDRLPNVTHQIIIVSLLEVAKEVEDAYERILGSS